MPRPNTSIGLYTCRQTELWSPTTRIRQLPTVPFLRRCLHALDGEYVLNFAKITIQLFSLAGTTNALPSEIPLFTLFIQDKWTNEVIEN